MAYNHAESLAKTSRIIPERIELNLAGCWFTRGDLEKVNSRNGPAESVCDTIAMILESMLCEPGVRSTLNF